MKQTNHHKHIRLLQALAALGTAAALSAGAATALTPQVVNRPLTPGDKTNYKLASSLETSAGLNTVPVGAAMYLEAEVNKALPTGDITSVTWALTQKPVGSAATFTDSPLGTNVPISELTDQSTLQVASRTLLRPDVTGQYTVTATIVSSSAGTTNVSATFTVGTYTGLRTCNLCHSGSVEAPDKYHPWQLTGHSMIFSNGVNGYLGHYSASCLSCHTVGYNANTNAVNGGFDDIAKQYGWTFPPVQTNGNFQSMPQALQNVANIQCENCHGPGSEHAAAFGNTSLPNWPRLSTKLTAGTCNQCHEAPTHHIKGTEWMNSRHAVSVEETEAGCSRCHSAQGFVNYAKGAPAVATAYETITCSACHEPHDVTNPHQVRKASAVTLMDNKTVITEGGTGLLCMNCHMSRRDATNYVEVTVGSNRFGPHHGPQADMLAGANAMNYGKDIPSSAHKDVVADACVTCHMQDAETSPAFTHAGGHTFSMKWDTGTNVIEMTEACVQCHGEIEGFNFKRQDYDGNGIVEGVQTEVKGLLSKLAIMLPPVGVPKPNHSPSNLQINSSWTKQQLRAGYDYLFVVEDGSYGIHNLSYTVGILKAAIADLSGDANNDGLADWWQTQYFGSPNDPKAAPNATPAGDGIPNWVKFALGLNPTVAGQPFPGGVVWANGSALGSSSATNTVQIYTAAEVAFNTEVGKSYQIQVISPLNGTWQNLGNPIVGDGKAVSYVTPTRQNVQQYYRVMTLQ